MLCRLKASDCHWLPRPCRRPRNRGRPRCQGHGRRCGHRCRRRCGNRRGRRRGRRRGSLAMHDSFGGVDMLTCVYARTHARMQRVM